MSIFYDVLMEKSASKRLADAFRVYQGTGRISRKTAKRLKTMFGDDVLVPSSGAHRRANDTMRNYVDHDEKAGPMFLIDAEGGISRGIQRQSLEEKLRENFAKRNPDAQYTGYTAPDFDYYPSHMSRRMDHLLDQVESRRMDHLLDQVENADPDHADIFQELDLGESAGGSPSEQMNVLADRMEATGMSEDMTAQLREVAERLSPSTPAPLPQHKAQPSPQPTQSTSPQRQSNLKRNLLLAGAGLTTAGGVGYMYHRRNDKKRSEQR